MRTKEDAPTTAISPSPTVPFEAHGRMVAEVKSASSELPAARSPFMHDYQLPAGDAEGSRATGARNYFEQIAKHAKKSKAAPTGSSTTAS